MNKNFPSNHFIKKDQQSKKNNPRISNFNYKKPQIRRKRQNLKSQREKYFKIKNEFYKVS